MIVQGCVLIIENAVSDIKFQWKTIPKSLLENHPKFNQNGAWGDHFDARGGTFGDPFQRSPEEISRSPKNHEKGRTNGCFFLTLEAPGALGGPFLEGSFFLKTRQGWKSFIFGAPGASQNREKNNKNEGRGKTWNYWPKCIDFLSLFVGPEPRNTLAG